jgi:PAS domain S-box-containing protein
MLKQSIRYRISWIVGVIVLITIMSIISYTGIKTKKEAVYFAETQMRTVLENSVQSIEFKINSNIKSMESHWKDLEILKDSKDFDRKELQKIYSNILQNDSLIIGYTVTFLPGEFDGKCNEYKGYPGFFDDGRFSEYIYKKDGKICRENETGNFEKYLVENGDEWWKTPSKNKENYIYMDLYRVEDRDVLMLSLVYAIIKEKKFKGIICIDLISNFIQIQALKAKNNLFGGKGKVTIFDQDGNIAADTKNPENIGKEINIFDSANSNSILKSIKKGNKNFFKQNNSYFSYIPIEFYGSSAKWQMRVEISEKIITSNARKTIQNQLIIGILSIIISILTIFIIIRKLLYPLHKLTKITEKITEGNLNTTIEIKSKNEIGKLAEAFNSMLKRLYVQYNEIQTSEEELSATNEELIVTSKTLEETNNELTKTNTTAIENYNRFKSAFENSNIGMALVAPDGNIIEANKSLCSILGYSSVNLISKTLDELVHREDRANDLTFKQQIFSGEISSYQIEKRYISKTNKIVWTIFNNSVVKDELNNPIYFVSQIQDISKEKQDKLEILQKNEELIQAKHKAEESDRLKSEFINNMSHEIRTPMNGILGFSDLLSDAEISFDKRAYYINIIQNSGNQLMRIIDDILEISKLGTKQVTAQNAKINISNILLHHFSIFDIKAKEKEIPIFLRNELSEDESCILSDESKINKILSNLIENALKFTNKGSIEIGCKIVSEKNIQEIEIFVKDSGIGIDPDKLDIIFERFAQGDKDKSRLAGGLGLGLSIAKENAEIIGGRIFVESIKNEGSTFYIRIPYIPVNNIIHKSKPQDYSIMIVEDEEINCLFMEVILKNIMKLNCKIIYAKNGKEAVDFCKDEQNIDIILMDIKMPVLDGISATRQIKKIRPEIKVIAQTAYTSNYEKTVALEAGCDEFISKPLEQEQFIQVINKFLKIS